MAFERTIQELLAFGAGELAHVSSSARLDAQVLLSHVTTFSRSKLLASPKELVSKDVVQQFEGFIRRRKVLEPVAYLVGHKEFFGLDFHVTPDVLIPRPETELLVEKALEFLHKEKGDLKILELGTGSGCISVAIGVELKKIGKPFRIIATDISPNALAIAKQNAFGHGVHSEIIFREGDWFSSDIGDGEKFQLIVSNPPYLKESEKLMADVLFEPKEALFGGSDGLDAIRVISASFVSHLRVPGILLLEIGFGQKEEVEAIIRGTVDSLGETPYRAEFFPDLAGIPRVVGVYLDGEMDNVSIRQRRITELQQEGRRRNLSGIETNELVSLLKDAFILGEGGLVETLLRAEWPSRKAAVMDLCKGMSLTFGSYVVRYPLIYHRQE